MKRILHIVACVLWFGFVAVATPRAIAASEIARGPAGDWVEVLKVPAADPRYSDRVQEGKSYLLSEYQVRPVEGGWETYDRVAYQIVDRTGLEAGASISLEFDPETEAVTINRLQIIRDGVVIDRLEAASIDLARREGNAERGVFDGRLTAYINLQDVRVGDIIDWATTRIRRPILGQALYYEAYSVEWTVPVGVFRVRVTRPAGSPFYYQSRETDLAPKVTTTGAETAYVWEVVNPEPIVGQSNVPPDHDVQGKIEMSSTRDWSDVVETVRPHYRYDQDLPADFAGKLAAVAGHYPDPADRLVEATRMVQDDIRYVSLSIGSGTYIPRSAAEVIASGFGDCKDKSMLLAIALRRLGIDADVALTDIDAGMDLINRLPGVQVFDHMIVRAKIAGRTYWVDPTNYLQGGRAADMAVPAYGFALPLSEGTSALEAIAVPRLVAPSTLYVETFDFPAKDGDPLRLGVTSTYRGDSADWMRSRLKRESIAKLSSDYVKYYNDQYPGIRSAAPLTASDDRDANIVVINESYALQAGDLIGDGLIKDFPLKGDVGLSDLPKPSRVDRTAPIWLGRPIFKQHKVVVRNLKARFTPPDDSAQKQFPFAALTAATRATDTSFEVIWTFMTMTDRLPAAYVNRYLKALDELWANTKWTFDFSYAAPKPGE